MPPKRGFARSEMFAAVRSTRPTTSHPLESVLPLDLTDLDPLLPEDDFWPDTYDEARHNFRRACVSATRAGARVDAHALFLRQPNGQALLGSANEQLSIDVATINWPAASEPLPEEVHICFSGVHGVEGYSGSEAQVRWMATEATAATRPTIMVHCVNPYGMSCGRRWNESGVDLNRNQYPRHALDDGWVRSKPSPWAAVGVHPVYSALNARVNPTAVRVGGIFPVGSWVDLVLLLLAMLLMRLRGYAFSEIACALSQGQVAYPTGLFFNGHRLEQGPRLLYEHLATVLRHSATSPTPSAAAVRRVVLVDLHTGLGKYAQHYALCDTEGDEPWFRERAPPGTTFAKFNKRELYPGDTQFAIRELLTWLAPAAVVRSVTLEVGTYNKLQVFRALRVEGTHHRVRAAAGAPPAVLARADTLDRRAVVAAFYPGVADPGWRRSAESLNAAFLRAVFPPAPAAAAAASGGKGKK